MDNTDNSCGWVRLWHRRGVQVTIPLRGDITTFDDQIEYLFTKSGFLAQSPGLESGETEEIVGWVVRSLKQGRTGIADVLHLYADNDAWTKPFLVKYLNTDKDRAEFETVAGFPLSRIPEYIGEGRIERGKNPSADKLIFRVPRPFGVVFKPNPKYDPKAAEAAKANQNGQPYTVPKKIWVRWADQKQPPASTPTAAPGITSPPAKPNGTKPPANAVGAQQGDVDAITEDQWRQIVAELGKHLISPEAFLWRYKRPRWQDIEASEFDKALARAKEPDDELRAAQKAMPNRISEAQWNTILAALERSRVSVDAFLRWTGYTLPTLIRMDDFDRFLRAAQNPPPDLRKAGNQAPAVARK